MNPEKDKVRASGFERQFEAILLLGPTGSGKTPLGELLAAGGLPGRRCFHFDFGQQLRLADADPSSSAFFTRKELEVVKTVLRNGTLLEDEHFGIAVGIIGRFVNCNAVKPSDLVILNGLPRHVGQAEAIGQFFCVRSVVCLQCEVRTVLARISRNTGGDRHNRADDALAEVSRRLQLFNERSLPLLDHYRSRGVPIAEVRVGSETSAVELLAGVTDMLAGHTSARCDRGEKG